MWKLRRARGLSRLLEGQKWISLSIRCPDQVQGGKRLAEASSSACGSIVLHLRYPGIRFQSKRCLAHNAPVCGWPGSFPRSLSSLVHVDLQEDASDSNESSLPSKEVPSEFLVSERKCDLAASEDNIDTDESFCIDELKDGKGYPDDITDIGLLLEDARVMSDAGNHFLPSSLLEVSLDDLLEDATEQGSQLWMRFKEAECEKAYSCRDIIEAWLADGNKVSRAALIYIILVFRRWNKYTQALAVCDWIRTENPYELTDLDHALQIDLLGSGQTVAAAASYLRNIPKGDRTARMFSVLMHVYLSHHKYKNTYRLLYEVQKLGLGEQTFLHNQLMFYFLPKKKFDAILQVLKWMGLRKLDPDVNTLNIVLDVVSKIDGVAALDIWKRIEIEKMLEPDAASYCILARCYINAGMIDDAINAIKKVESSPFRDKRVVYQWLLKLYSKIEKACEVQRIWDVIKGSSKVMVGDYSVLIRSLGMMGEVEKAEEVFSEMKEKPGIKCLHQYISLLSVYTDRCMVEKVKKLQEEISEAFGCTPNMYHQIISMYVKSGDSQKALETLYEACRTCQISPRFSSFYVVLEMLAEHGCVESAESVLEELKAAGYKCNLSIYRMLLNAYVKANVDPSGLFYRMKSEGLIRGKIRR